MERLQESNSTIEELSGQVQELKRRVAALELRAELSPQSSLPLAYPGPVLATPPLPPVTGGMLLAVGTALLGLAGAYLIRATAESGAVPQLAAVLAALVFAVGWLVWSARIGLRDRFSMSLYCLTAALIVSAMLWETTANQRVLPPALSAAMAALFTGVGLALAWPRNLSAIAWIATLAGVATSLVLLIATRDLVPFIAALLAMAAAIEYAAFRGRSPGQRWLAAFAADFSIFLLLFVMSRSQGWPEGYRAIPLWNAIVLGSALVLIYVLGTGYRTIWLRGDISAFEIGQTVVAVSLFVGGAMTVVHAGDGAFCLVAGATCYTASLTVLRRLERQRNFHVYMTLGLALLLTGTWMLLSGWGLALVWSALAVGAMAGGKYLRRVSIQMQAPVYLLAAALAGSIAGAGHEPWPILLTTLTAALCYAAAGRCSSTLARIPQAAAAAILCWSALSFAAAVITAATLRTGLICGLAILLAFASTRYQRRELLWLVYPLMLLGAIKLLLQDFAHGRPVTVALSLLFYGATLAVLPKLGQRHRSQVDLHAENGEFHPVSIEEKQDTSGFVGFS